jgi:hypothetical protein
LIHDIPDGIWIVAIGLGVAAAALGIQWLRIRRDR